MQIKNDEQKVFIDFLNSYNECFYRKDIEKLKRFYDYQNNDTYDLEQHIDLPAPIIQLQEIILRCSTFSVMNTCSALIRRIRRKNTGMFFLFGLMLFIDIMVNNAWSVGEDNTMDLLLIALCGMNCGIIKIL